MSFDLDLDDEHFAYAGRWSSLVIFFSTSDALSIVQFMHDNCQAKTSLFFDDQITSR